jgi:hypothetical protein
MESRTPIGSFYSGRADEKRLSTYCFRHERLIILGALVVIDKTTHGDPGSASR